MHFAIHESRLPTSILADANFQCVQKPRHHESRYWKRKRNWLPRGVTITVAFVLAFVITIGIANVIPITVSVKIAINTTITITITITFTVIITIFVRVVIANIFTLFFR